MDSHPPQAGKATDARHQPVLDAIAAEYLAATGVKAPTMSRTAGALARFLRENRDWPCDRLVAAVCNRFRSDNVNYAEPPWAWIEYLPSYATGPLDKFGRIKASSQGPVARGQGLGKWDPKQIAEIRKSRGQVTGDRSQEKKK